MRAHDNKRRRLLKVVLLGDGGVGKSSLLTRYVSGRFSDASFHTIGVEFVTHDVRAAGRDVTLQIWDTAGQERFRSLRTPFYRGADCCMLTFALDDGESFARLSTWRDEFVRHADVARAARFPFIVLGNKSDVAARAVDGADVRAWCCGAGMPYYETSARDGSNVEAAFLAAAIRVIAADDDDDRRRDEACAGLADDTVDLTKTVAQNAHQGCC